MKISPVTTPVDANQSNASFKALSIPKKTFNLLTQAVENGELNPVRFTAMAKVLSDAPDLYTIMRHEGSGSLVDSLFGARKFIISKQSLTGDSSAVVTSIENMFNKLGNLDAGILEQIEITTKQITHNLVETIKYLSTGTNTIKVETRNVCLLDKLGSSKGIAPKA